MFNCGESYVCKEIKLLFLIKKFCYFIVWYFHKTDAYIAERIWINDFAFPASLCHQYIKHIIIFDSWPRKT